MRDSYCTPPSSFCLFCVLIRWRVPAQKNKSKSGREAEVGEKRRDKDTERSLPSRDRELVPQVCSHMCNASSLLSFLSHWHMTACGVSQERDETSAVLADAACRLIVIPTRAHRRR